MTHTEVNTEATSRVHAAADETAELSGPAVDEVVRALLAIIDAGLDQGPERRHVLATSMDVIALGPSVADLAAAFEEVVAEHDSLIRAVGTFPGQRGAAPDGSKVTDRISQIRDRRIEVLHLASKVIQVPNQRH